MFSINDVLCFYGQWFWFILILKIGFLFQYFWNGFVRFELNKERSLIKKQMLKSNTEVMVNIGQQCL